MWHVPLPLILPPSCPPLNILALFTLALLPLRVVQCWSLCQQLLCHCKELHGTFTKALCCMHGAGKEAVLYWVSSLVHDKRTQCTSTQGSFMMLRTLFQILPLIRIIETGLACLAGCYGDYINEVCQTHLSA